MTSGESLRETAQLVDVLRDVGIDVEDVTVTADADGELVELAVRLPGDAAELVDDSVGGPTEVPLDGDRAGGSDGRDGDESGDETSDDNADRQDADSAPEAVTAATLQRADESAESPDEDPAADTVSCRVEDCDRTFGSSHGMKIHAAKSHDVEEAGDEQPHRDPERLQAVYETNETFDEMRDALGADVTAQTVRRNMMKFGIHEPEADGLERQLGRVTGDGEIRSGASPEDPGDAEVDGESDGPSADGAASDEPDDSPADDDPAEAAGDVERTEGLDAGDEDAPAGEEASGTGAADDPSVDPVGDVRPSPSERLAVSEATLRESLDLPDRVDLDSFVEAVTDARTMFEFTQALGVDRAEAQELLVSLNCSNLVTGRVGTDPVEETPEEEVVRRIADALDAPAGGSDGLSAD